MPPERVQDLSWDAFPEPPPEAATWKPDPAYIASPGQLKDPRFNKDRYEAGRLKATRKDAARLSSASPMSSASGSNNLNAGKWPPQVRRSGEPVRSPLVSAPSSSTSEPANTEQGGPSGRNVHVPAKEYVENFEVKPPNSHTPVTPPRVTPPRSISPVKTSLPAWTGPLEKALAEDTSKISVLPTQTEVKSIPSHLRNTSNVVSTGPPSEQRRELRPVATKHQPALLNLDASFKAACETTRRVSGSKTSTPSAVNDADLLRREASTSKTATPRGGRKSVEHDAEVNEMLANLDNIQRPESAADDGRYKNLGHYLKMVLVLAMQKDIWEQELLKLSEKELEDHMLNLSSKHEQLWESKHGRGGYPHNGVSNGVHGQ